MDAVVPDLATALAITVPLVAKFESFRAEPYQDDGGRWTYGYGQTTRENGSPVTMNTPPTTEAAAMQWMTETLAKTMGLVILLVTVPITNNQCAALTSLAYNIGTGEAGFRGSSLLRLLNAGDISGAACQFLVWDHVHGAVDQGLVNRRNKEMILFNTPDSPAVGVTMSATTTPSQPATTPMFHSDNITAHPGSTMAGVGVAISAVGTLIGTTGVPTTTTGWVAFIGAMLAAIGAAFGR